MTTALFVKALGGFFAIMNPFVALPMFLSLTDGYDLPRQRRTALRVALYSLVLSLVVLLAGRAILDFFGIGVDDFRIAGGLVLMTIALGLLNGAGSAAHSGSESEKEHQTEQAAQSDVAFYPMAFPMMVGPGTITAIIVFTGGTGDMSGYLAVGAALVAVLLLLAVVLWFAPVIGHHMSMTLRVIMTRLMGMILAAIAVEMMVAGLGHVLPGLTR